MSLDGDRGVCERHTSASRKSIVEPRMWSFAVFDEVCKYGYEVLEDAGSMLGAGDWIVGLRMWMAF